ncbi:MAG: hypothetical protein ACYDHF_09045 [Candidatus Cryosericum sp.]
MTEPGEVIAPGVQRLTPMRAARKRVTMTAAVMIRVVRSRSVGLGRERGHQECDEPPADWKTDHEVPRVVVDQESRAEAGRAANRSPVMAERMTAFA